MNRVVVFEGDTRIGDVMVDDGSITARLDDETLARVANAHANLSLIDGAPHSEESIVLPAEAVVPADDATIARELIAEFSRRGYRAGLEDDLRDDVNAGERLIAWLRKTMGRSADDQEDG